MKNQDEVKKKIEFLLKELLDETNPLNYIYGRAQIRALTWIIENKEEKTE